MIWTLTSKNVQNPQRVAQFQSSNSTYMEDGSSSCFKEFVFVYKYIRSFWWNPSPPNHHHRPSKILYFCSIVIYISVVITFLLRIIIIIQIVFICVNWIIYFCWHLFTLIFITIQDKYKICIWWMMIMMMMNHWKKYN